MKGWRVEYVDVTFSPKKKKVQTRSFVLVKGSKVFNITLRNMQGKEAGVIAQMKHNNMLHSQFLSELLFDLPDWYGKLMVCIFCFTVPSEVNVNTWTKQNLSFGCCRYQSELIDYNPLNWQILTHVVFVIIQQDFKGLKTSVKLLICTWSQLDQHGKLWTCFILKYTVWAKINKCMFFFSWLHVSCHLIVLNNCNNCIYLAFHLG